MTAKLKKPVLIPDPDCKRCGGSGKRLSWSGVIPDFPSLTPCACLRPVADLPLLRGAKVLAGGGR